MTPTAPIPASLATACAAHDRHRLDVLDALLDEAAPSAVRELLGAALDLCATLRTERDELRAKLDAAPKVCAIHSYEHGPGPCMTCGAWPPGTRELIATCRTRIARLEQAADERSAEVARLTARVAELEARPVLTVERLDEELVRGAAEVTGNDGRAWRHKDIASAIVANLGPVTLPAQDRAEELYRAYLEAQKGWNGVVTVDAARAVMADAMRRALASLGAPPTSPPAARPVFAGGVSEEELAVIFARVSGHDADYTLENVDDRDRAAVRAVLARLEVSLVAPVDPEAVARDYHDAAGTPAWAWHAVGRHALDCPTAEDHRQAQMAAAYAMRATLTARGIPVTPEVGK